MNKDTLYILSLAVCFATGTALWEARAAVSDTNEDPASRISRSSATYRPLVCVGATAPSDAENQALWQEVERMRKTGIGPRAEALEQFLRDYSGSPWAASIHANLGRHYQGRGLYTKALPHWQAAWSEARNEAANPGKQVADFTFAYWTRLLAHLGRVNELTALFEETRSRVFDRGPLQQMVEASRYEYMMMRDNTEGTFRCGTYALNSLARLVARPSYNPAIVMKVPAPVTGFSMSKLLDMAKEAQLDLIAVRWGSERTPVVPSLVHWKQDHYATIVAEKNGLYEVVDPAFGKPRWAALQDIAEEASGSFIIPRAKLPDTWRVMTRDETDEVLGRGLVESCYDDDDSCSNGSGGGSGGGGLWGGGSFGTVGSDSSIATTMSISGSSGGFPPVCRGCGAGGGPSGGGSGSGGGGMGCCPEGSGDPSSQAGLTPASGNEALATGRGMPIWEVSEPYINLWLYDEPLGYQPGLGRRISFKLAYKQRESRELSDHFFNLGPMWNCSWLSYVFQESYAKVVAPGGGERTGLFVDKDYYSHTLTDIAIDEDYMPTNAVVTYPDGAKDYYEYVPGELVNGCRAVLMSARANAQGQTTRFHYQEQNQLVLLKYVVDTDGRTNTLTYTNTSYPTRITGVQDPFGHLAVLKYDSDGVLTNVVDSAGLSTSFQYDQRGWITNLATPYGTTTFEHFINTQDPENEFNVPTDWKTLVRAVRVVDPVGGTNVYMLRQDSSQVTTNGTDYVDFMPDSYSSGVPTSLPTPGLENVYLMFRNSFHWGPRQASQLPLDLTRFGFSDYLKARLRHWLHSYSGGGAAISQSVSLEQEPSPDGVTWGQTTWYDYDGKNLNEFLATMREGTQSSPALAARVLPDGTTWYKWFRRDEWGRATNVVETYSTGFGATPLTRTNVYVYDGNGVDLARIIGPEGATVAGYFYDSNHRVLRATNAVGDVTYYTYDAAGRLSSRQTAAGLTTTNLYFSSGWYTNWVQTTIDLEIGRTNSFTYTNNLVYTHTDERGVITTNMYDALGRLTTASDPRGTVFYTYTNLDLIRVVDRMGYTNSFGYDAVRRLTASTNALGYYTLHSYCSCGGLESTRDAEGNYTSYFYDNAGRTTLVSHPDGFTVYYGYSLLGQLTNVADSAGLSITNWYNNQGLNYAVSNAYGRVKAIAFDLEDRATNSVDGNGVIVVTTYDPLGRVLSRTYPDSGIERFGYSTRGLVAYTNQLNLTNFYAYDPARRKTFETNANWEITEFRYDPSGNLTNLIDAKSQGTIWKYDLYSRVTNKTDHLGNTLFAYGYDANSPLTNRTSAAKGATAYRYDPTGNLTNIVYPVSPAITLQYDRLNRLTNMVDAVGTTRYSYDAAGLLLTEDGPWSSDTVTSSYDNRLRSSLSLAQPNASAWVQSYTYDLAKRLTNVTSAAGAFGYRYAHDQSTSPGALVRKLLLPNGAFITNTFDSAARLLSTSLKNSGGTILNSHQYVYNPGNQRTQQVFTAGNFVNYTYDKIGQLKTAFGSESGGAARSHEQFGYVYDAAGNLDWRTNGALVQNFEVNSLNELSTASRSGTLTVAGATTRESTGVTVNGASATTYADNTFAKEGFSLADGNNTFTAVAADSYGRQDTTSVTAFLPATASYAYDLNGNLLSDGRRGFDYDDENQLIRVTVTNAWKSEFVYDGKMRRRKRAECTWNGSGWSTNQIICYIYDGNLVIQERELNPQLSTLSPLASVSYTRGKDLSGSLDGAGGIGGLLARSTLNADPPTHAYYHADGNGNVTALIGTNQLSIAQYLYDPFGNILAQSGTLAEANLYRFSSKEYHPSSGLVYYLYRAYDPGLQRWLNRDPIADVGGMSYIASEYNPVENWEGQNLYAFGRNCPMGFIDSDGRFVIAIPIGGAVVTIGQGATIGLALCMVIPSCRQALQDALARTIDKCRPTPRQPDCRLVAQTARLCLYSCSSPGGPYQGAIDKPPGGCPETASHDDVKPMPGRDYPGFPPK